MIKNRTFLLFFLCASVGIHLFSDVAESVVVSEPAAEEAFVEEMPAQLRMMWAMMLEGLIEELSDEEEIAFIQSIADNPDLLQEQAVVERAQKIFERVELIKQLQAYQEFAKTDTDKKLFDDVLQDLSLLKKEDIQQRLAVIIQAIQSEQKEHAENGGIAKINTNFKRVQLGLISLFTLYRKMVYVRDIDNNYLPGDYQKWFNRFAFVAYIGGKVTEGILTLLMQMQDPEQALKGDAQSGFDIESVNDAGMGARNLVANDLYTTLKKRLEEKQDEKNDDESKPKNKKAIRDFIKSHGYAGHIFDFYDQYDAYLNKEIEKREDVILEKIKIPNALRVLMLKNGIFRFVQRALIFKILPTYFYYSWRNCFYFRMLFGFYRTESLYETYFKDYFESSRSFKEAIKSSGDLGRAMLVNSLVRKINGRMTQTNKGRFYNMKDRTFGIISPNTVKYFSEIYMPKAMVKGSELVGATKDWLKENDFPTGQNLRQYALQTVIATFMLKYLRTKDSGMMSWTGKMIKSVLSFLQRRNLLSEDTVEFVSMLAPLSQLSVLLYVIASGGDTAIVTSFDMQEATVESQQMDDQYRLLDYFIANVTGKLLGAWINNRVFA